MCVESCVCVFLKVRFFSENQPPCAGRWPVNVVNPSGLDRLVVNFLFQTMGPWAMVKKPLKIKPLFLRGEGAFRCNFEKETVWRTTDDAPMFEGVSD